MEKKAKKKRKKKERRERRSEEQRRKNAKRRKQTALNRDETSVLAEGKFATYFVRQGAIFIAFSYAVA